MERYKYWAIVGLLSVIIILIAGSIFPAPYNLNYAFKRILYKETALCSDGTYSFTTIPRDMCKGHGRIIEHLP